MYMIMFWADKKMTFLHVDYRQAGYTRQLDQDCYIDYDKIFTVSSEVSRSFLSVYPECKGKTEVFHNLIDQEEIRRKAMLPGGFSDIYDGFRILTVGRLTSQKAYEIAVDAMYKVKNAGVRARWYVLGEGELRNSLQAQIDGLGLQNDFILLGTAANPYPYYRQCDLYVHATRFEGKKPCYSGSQDPWMCCSCLELQRQQRAGNRWCRWCYVCIIRRGSEPKNN